MSETARADLATIEEVAKTFKLILDNRLHHDTPSHSLAMRSLESVVAMAKLNLEVYGARDGFRPAKPFIPGACL